MRMNDQLCPRARPRVECVVGGGSKTLFHGVPTLCLWEGTLDSSMACLTIDSKYRKLRHHNPPNARGRGQAEQGELAYLFLDHQKEATFSLCSATTWLVRPVDALDGILYVELSIPVPFSSHVRSTRCDHETSQACTPTTSLDESMESCVAVEPVDGSLGGRQGL